MAKLENIIVDGIVHFTDRSTKDLQEVYANVARENDERCQLCLFGKNDLGPFRKYNIGGGETFGIDSGVIQHISTGLFNRGKPKVKEMHYVSIIKRDETLTLILKTKSDRQTWKGKLRVILDLDREPKKMNLFSTKEGSQQVTLHMNDAHNDAHIAVLSERADHHPAGLKFSWRISDIKNQNIDGNQIILKNNQDIEYRLESRGHSGPEDLESIIGYINLKKKRMKRIDDQNPVHPVPPVAPPSASSTVTSPPRGTPPVERSEVPSPHRREPHLGFGFPNTPILPHSTSPADDSSSDDEVPPGACKGSGRSRPHLPPRITIPPPPPCPGPGPDPFLIYSFPAILRHFKPKPSDKRDSINLNKVAEVLPQNLNDTEIFSKKRASLFNKFTECHRRSTYTPLNPNDVRDVQEIASPFENVEVPPSVGTQTNFDDIKLDKEEQIIYRVGYIIHKVILEPPEKDTLNLPEHVKKEICMNLYSTSFEASRRDWKILANEIGMTVKAVNMISGFIQNQMAPGYQTCAEVVLRHWQYVYNTYPPGHRHYPRYPCTQTGLKDVLRKIGRHDLCRLL